jgi:hypothetical protein
MNGEEAHPIDWDSVVDDVFAFLSGDDDPRVREALDDQESPHSRFLRKYIEGAGPPVPPPPRLDPETTIAREGDLSLDLISAGAEFGPIPPENEIRTSLGFGLPTDPSDAPAPSTAAPIPSSDSPISPHTFHFPSQAFTVLVLLCLVFYLLWAAKPGAPVAPPTDVPDAKQILAKLDRMYSEIGEIRRATYHSDSTRNSPVPSPETDRNGPVAHATPGMSTVPAASASVSVPEVGREAARGAEGKGGQGGRAPVQVLVSQETRGPEAPLGFVLTEGHVPAMSGESPERPNDGISHSYPISTNPSGSIPVAHDNPELPETRLRALLDRGRSEPVKKVFTQLADEYPKLTLRLKDFATRLVGTSEAEESKGETGRSDRDLFGVVVRCSVAQQVPAEFLLRGNSSSTIQEFLRKPAAEMSRLVVRTSDLTKALESPQFVKKYAERYQSVVGKLLNTVAQSVEDELPPSP